MGADDVTGLSPLVLEIIIVLLVLAVLFSFRDRIKLAVLRMKLSSLRRNVERLEAYRAALETRVEQAKWRAKHKLPPAA